MCTMNYMWQSEVDDKGKRPVKGHTNLHDHLVYANDTSRKSAVEESRLFLDALDLLNMRKELFWNVLRDPNSSLAQQMHEKRLSKSRVRLTKSMSFPSPRALEAKNVNFKHESHYPYTSTEESSDQSMCVAEQPQRQPKSTGNVSQVFRHCLSTRQDKIGIKRFKNLGDIIRHAIKDSRKEKRRIIKDAVLDKIPGDKKSTGYKGQGETSEKPSNMYKKSNLEQKSFSRAPSFDDSIEKYNRLLESDSSREEKGKEYERPTLRTTTTPSPITSIPKRLDRIYSSPDLVLFHGLQNEEPLDSTCWANSNTSVGVNCTSTEENIMLSEQTYLESNSNTENQIQIDKILNCESQENVVDSSEGLDATSKCENIEGARIDEDKASKCESLENFVDDDDFLDTGSKCESQENFVDDGERLDGTVKYDSGEKIGDVGEGLDRISKCESGNNFVDSGFEYTGDLNSTNSAPNIDLVNDEPILGVVDDSSYMEDDTNPAKCSIPDVILHDGEDSLVSQQQELSRDGTAIYENERGSSSTWFHDTGISKVQVDTNNMLKFDYVKVVLDLSGFNKNELLGKWHSPGQPVHPEVLDEVEENLLVQSELYEREDKSYDLILLFDLVNEVLLDIYHKSSSYWPKALSFRSYIHPMPKGHHVLEEVWADINSYLHWKPTTGKAYFDDGDAVAQDMAKYDGWMNLQFDSECAGLELEELLFDDLVEELLSDIPTLEII